MILNYITSTFEIVYITSTSLYTLEITQSQTPVQNIFNPVHGVNAGIYYRTIHPQNITLSVQDVFVTYMNNLIEFNENLDPPLYLPSHLESLKEKYNYVEVPDLETKIPRHDNPHYWLQQDILQITHFQYRFFQNIVLNGDTIPQIKIFSIFYQNFFDSNTNYYGNNKIKTRILTIFGY